MYEIGTVSHFEAAHRLTGDFGPGTNLHGHTYRLEVTLRGERLDDQNALFDLGQLDERIAVVVAQLHMKNLDDVPGLAGSNTTAEGVARYVWYSLADGLNNHGFASLSIRLWESPRVFAGYEAPLHP